MRRTARVLGACAVSAVAWMFVWAAPPAAAASFNCKARALSLSEIAVCRDPQLSRTDEQTVRRVDGFARRLNYGQYLGLRYWHSEQARDRERCGSDVICLSASYRTQIRFLDRLQQCLETNQRRRGCLRATLGSERDSEDTAFTKGSVPSRAR